MRYRGKTTKLQKYSPSLGLLQKILSQLSHYFGCISWYQPAIYSATGLLLNARNLAICSGVPFGHLSDKPETLSLIRLQIRPTTAGNLFNIELFLRRCLSVFATVLPTFCFKNTEIALRLNRCWGVIPKAVSGQKKSPQGFAATIYLL